MSGRTRDYHFDLPEELVASYPLSRREDARMLVLDRKSGNIGHRRFADFPDYLRPGDLTVLNDSKVMKARVWSDDRRTELLLLREWAPHEWLCLGRPGKRLKEGAIIQVGGVKGVVKAILEDGERRIAFDGPLDLDAVGEIPLPPYMKREGQKIDDERYQTVFARSKGSVAAPTAGLHFTPDVLARISHAFVTLHVGVGTFRPVSSERVDEHRMHAEEYEIDQSAADSINKARRLVVVGTTATRVLESQPQGPILPRRGSTDIFIHPPYSFQRVDVLLTNFHLPCSTLLMLVCAFAGREIVLDAYREAVRERYRFFSYGDCMLIL